VDRFYANPDVTVTGLKPNRVDARVKRMEELSMSLPKIHK
jgi:hypothetical protein